MCVSLIPKPLAQTHQKFRSKAGFHKQVRDGLNVFNEKSTSNTLQLGLKQKKNPSDRWAQAMGENLEHNHTRFDSGFYDSMVEPDAAHLKVESKFSELRDVVTEESPAK
eukprot:9601672-Alexandrium_andersonii.AAC.1